MTNKEMIIELRYTIDLIKQNGQDWLDERDIPILEAAISALQAQDVPDTNVGDMISRWVAIEAAEKESQIDGAYGYMDTKSIIDMLEQLPSAQSELIRCRDCKYWQDQQEGVVEVPICARPENKYEKLPFRFIIGEDGFCSFAERRTDD